MRRRFMALVGVVRRNSRGLLVACHLAISAAAVVALWLRPRAIPATVITSSTNETAAATAAEVLPDIPSSPPDWQEETGELLGVRVIEVDNLCIAETPTRFAGSSRRVAGDGFLARINGEYVKAGDYCRFGRVERIFPDGVFTSHISGRLLIIARLDVVSSAPDE